MKQMNEVGNISRDQSKDWKYKLISVETDNR